MILHADDFDSSLATLTDKQVSSHYLVPAVPPRYNGKPRIWQLVPEQELVRHAGISARAGQRALTTPLLALSWKTVAGKIGRSEIFCPV